MHDQLGGDEERQCDQETHVHLEVADERDGDVVADSPARGERQQQQRQPGDGGQDDDPPRQQFQGVARKARAPQQLEQRPAEHERKVGLLFLI